MTWINMNDHLPPNNDKFNGKLYLVTVIRGTWGEKAQTMIMGWECTKIRNKEVKRWKWKDRIKDDNWQVTHWREERNNY